MTTKIEEILSIAEETEKKLRNIHRKIVDLETQAMVISRETGIPFELGRRAYYIPERFCDAMGEYDEDSDQEIMREFENQFEEYFYKTEYGAGIWQPSRNC